MAYLLARNIRYEEDLEDQLFQLERKECAFHSKLTGWSGGGGYRQTVIAKEHSLSNFEQFSELNH